MYDLLIITTRITRLISIWYNAQPPNAFYSGPGMTMTELPPPLAVKAFFGLTMIKGVCAEAGYFIFYLLSPVGQRILADFGFIPVCGMFVQAPPDFY